MGERMTCKAEENEAKKRRGRDIKRRRCQNSGDITRDNEDGGSAAQCVNLAS